MISVETSNKIQSLYKLHLNNISLFTNEDLKLLMNYLTEHALFEDIKKNKGYTIFKKILLNMRLKHCEKDDTMIKFDSVKNTFNIILSGEIKKRKFIKGFPQQGLNNNSSKKLFCIYHCLTDCLFAEIDKDVYVKYIVSKADDLYNKFMEKINKYSLFHRLANYEYNNLFLNYDERKYDPYETIYEEGDNIDGIYLIRKGKCLILKKKENILLNNYTNTIRNSRPFFNKNFSNTYSNDFEEYDTWERNNKLFQPIFAKNTKTNNALLIMSVGDIFGDLEINLNNNQREFSVKCANSNKTKVWFFSSDIIKDIIINFKEISIQKYDIIRTRFKYVNIANKIKKENEINQNEITMDDTMSTSKNKNNNNSLKQKINVCTFQPWVKEVYKVLKAKKNKKINNIFLTNSRDKSLKVDLRFINNNLNSHSQSKLKILPYNPPKKIISITKEDSYAKKNNLNSLAIKSINIPNIPKISHLKNNKSSEKKVFLKKIKKNNAKSLLKFSNNETF